MSNILLFVILLNEANLAFGITTSDFYVPDSDEIQLVNRGIIDSGDVFLFDTFSIRYLGNFYRSIRVCTHF